MGYFVTPNWQIGGGLIYENANRRTYNGSVSDSQLTARVFGRYTNIAGGEGWDLTMESLVNDSTRLEMAGRYFFNRRFSAGVSYITEFADDDIYTNDDIGQLTVDYWFNSAWSVQAGAGIYVGGEDSGLASLTLATSLRF
ncbi:hypothetical protein BFC17_08580 [Alteromonas lipolytica]|uniref:Porin domain-containing protein n=1 Tax=Alteromonas lipolytica TaxID=1856405 RepID=A0A1E8FL64_9ALTE|nr:hypothetical protein BFC17_08580 [Alteromonas lipolytica]